MPKLIVIGLDGADEKLIASLIHQEELTNLKKVIAGGCWGPLKSTIPPLTIPAWPAMFSGKSSFRLNAVDFFRLENDYSLSYFTSRHWKKQMLWAMLGQHGLRCGVINVPGTNPAYPINGFMISSTFGDIQVYPEELEQRIDILPFKKAARRFKKAVTRSGLLKAAEREFQENASLALHLAEQEKWDVFIWVIRLADIAMHRGNMQDIKKAYLTIDRHLAPILQLAQKNNCNILIASDHGIQSTTRTLNINTFLEKTGYLKFNPGISNFKIARPQINSKLKALLLTGYRLIRNIKKIPPPSSPRIIHKSIAWDKTRAFALMEICHNFIGIWLNTRENFALGTIHSAREKESIRGDIINCLQQLRDTDGSKPVANIMAKEELFAGASGYIPDLFVELNENYSPGLRPVNKIISPNRKFIHSPYGVFIACGPDIINSEEHLSGLRLIDIAPTILHMFDLPIPQDMDGRPIKNIFKPDSSIFSRQIKYTELSSGEDKEEIPDSLEFKEEKVIRERLKKLGYL